MTVTSSEMCSRKTSSLHRWGAALILLLSILAMGFARAEAAPSEASVEGGRATARMASTAHSGAKTSTPAARKSKPVSSVGPRLTWVVDRCEKGRVVLMSARDAESEPWSMPRRILPGPCEEGQVVRTQVLRGRRRGENDGLSRRTWMSAEVWGDDGVYCRIGERSERLPGELFRPPLNRDEPITLVVQVMKTGFVPAKVARPTDVGARRGGS